MKKKENLENQFNTMSAGPGGNADARAARRKGMVVSFGQLEQQLFEFGADNKPMWVEQKDAAGKVLVNGDNQPLYERVLREDAPANLVTDFYRMEAFMNDIDLDPSSYDAIQQFGLPPITKLGEIAKKQIDIQQNFHSQINVMKKAQNELTQSGFEEFLKAGKDALLASGKVAGKGLGLLTKLLQKAKPKEEKTEEQMHREQMQAQLPKMMQTMSTLVKNIEGCETGLVQVLGEAAELGAARNECARELALYLGCKEEIERRYREVYIPEAQEFYAETNSQEDKDNLDAVLAAQMQFMDRMLSLTGQKALSDVGAQEMQRAILTMQQQRTQIQNIVQNSLPHWYSMLSAMGFAASSLEAAGMIKDSNDFSNNMHKITQDMLGTASDMTKQAQLQGVVDYKLIIESTQKLQAQVESDRTAMQERTKQLELQMDAMTAANNNLLESTTKAQESQLTLDSAKSAAAPATPANNNATPAAPAAKTPRRTPGTGR